MSNLENHNPQVIRQISKEVKSLTTEQLEGIKVNINEADLTDIQAIIDGPAGTPYAGGQFRVKLTLPKDFPSNPPKAYFLTKIFHPNVASNGEICVNTLKKDWKPDLGIKHILLTIKCLLIVPNPG
jgi:ubiquitin-conjugating enzyme E2 S